MEKFSDYIPLIIIIASVLFSIVSGLKKKATEITVKTVLPGNIGREDKPIESSRPVFIPVEKKLQNENRIKQLVAEEKKRNKQLPKREEMILPQKSNQDNLLIETEESQSILLNISEAEDWKRAIIYSEILQRKEY